MSDQRQRQGDGRPVGEHAFTIRAVSPDDDSPGEQIASAARAAGGFGLVLADANRFMLAGAIDPRGCATEPNQSLLILGEAAGGVDRAIAEAAEKTLISELLDEARRRGVERVVARCDPMDRRQVKLLERRGFRPTGRMAYFEAGGGYVEYVDGYRDATGSLVDLACRP